MKFVETYVIINLCINVQNKYTIFLGAQKFCPLTHKSVKLAILFLLTQGPWPSLRKSLAKSWRWHWTWWNGKHWFPSISSFTNKLCIGHLNCISVSNKQSIPWTPKLTTNFPFWVLPPTPLNCPAFYFYEQGVICLHSKILGKKHASSNILRSKETDSAHGDMCS